MESKNKSERQWPVYTNTIAGIILNTNKLYSIIGTHTQVHTRMQRWQTTSRVADNGFFCKSNDLRYIYKHEGDKKKLLQNM